jgi:hypothetical protein
VTGDRTTRIVAVAVLTAVAIAGAVAPGPSAFAGGGASSTASAHGGLTDDLDCSACHTTDGWGLSGTAEGSGFDHDRTGFPLRGEHVSTQCTGCHAGQKELPTTCEGCHRDPHERRMDGTCEECHTATDWKDTEALADHRLTRMPLTGRHATVDCTGCHTRQSDRTWSDAPVDCYACHATDYHADVHPDHDGDAADPSQSALSRDCGRCHRTTGWSPAVVDPATIARRLGVTVEHDAWFELSTGSHQDAACADCHVGKKRTARVRCDGCHARAELRTQHPGQRAGRTAATCLRCHPRGAPR